jgi:hypothetical protein
MTPPPPAPNPLHIADWVARSGISIVFACALLWWVLAEQGKQLERIASQTAATAQAVERLNQRIDLTCPPYVPTAPR